VLRTRRRNVIVALDPGAVLTRGGDSIMSERPKTSPWSETAFSAFLILLGGYAILANRRWPSELGGRGWTWQHYFAVALLVAGTVVGLIAVARWRRDKIP
jgi:hypothetical protein